MYLEERRKVLQEECEYNESDFVGGVNSPPSLAQTNKTTWRSDCNNGKIPYIKSDTNMTAVI